MFCSSCVIEWWRSAPLAAAVYGVAMAVITGWVAAMAVRLFMLGTLLLAGCTETACSIRASALWPKAGVALIVVLFYTSTVLVWVPMPGGQWMPLVYFGLGLVPTGLAAGLVWLLAFVLRHGSWS